MKAFTLYITCIEREFLLKTKGHLNNLFLGTRIYLLTPINPSPSIRPVPN